MTQVVSDIKDKLAILFKYVPMCYYCILCVISFCCNNSCDSREWEILCFSARTFQRIPHDIFYPLT